MHALLAACYGRGCDRDSTQPHPPRAQNILANFGYCRLFQQRTKEAARLLRASLAIDPDFALARGHLEEAERRLAEERAGAGGQ